jgi:hypothetical protein
LLFRESFNCLMISSGRLYALSFCIIFNQKDSDRLKRFRFYLQTNLPKF